MILKPCNGKTPEIHKDARIAENAAIIGDVSLGAGVSVWYGAVIRADACAIRVGENSNVQDCCCLHGAKDTTVGKNVTIGHGAIVHGCTVEDNCLIGMGAIVLDGARLGDHCMVGAGAVVTGKMDAPAGSLILGSPAKVVRPLRPDEIEMVREDAEIYHRNAELYRSASAE